MRNLAELGAVIWSISWVMEGRELPPALAKVRTLLWKHLWLVYIRSPFLYKQGFWAWSTWRHTRKTISDIALPLLERQKVLGGLTFLNCFSAEQLLYQYPDLQGCQRRVKNRNRDEASLWELPLPSRHRNMCYSLPLWQTWATWLSPPTHACQLVVLLSFSIKLVKPAPQPLHQILLLAWCHFIPCLLVGERVIPSTGKDATSLSAKGCTVRNRLCPIPSLR